MYDKSLPSQRVLTAMLLVAVLVILLQRMQLP